ncbi:MAG: hypothetical protein ABIG70_02350 [Pseudomonadota bacterium]
MARIKFYSIVCGLVFLLVRPAIAASPPDFNVTLQKLQRAIATKDVQTLSQHIALDTIVQNKIKRYSAKMQQNRGLAMSIAGQATNLGSAPLAKLASNYILNEFKNSSVGTRSYYLKSYTIKKVEQNSGRASVTGTFVGEGAKLFAVFTNGRWVIVGAESAFMDREFTKLLQILQKQIDQKKKENIIYKGLRKLKLW